MGPAPPGQIAGSTDAAPLPSGQLQALKDTLADRYAVEKEVGVGAMGVVYEARDVRHDRRVALKVLRPEIAASVGTDRFLREIRIEAQLSHPHIVPIYDSGEAEGLLYCVMPFVEGESLRERLDREGQLPCSEALRVCREIADALSFAHAHDVIHRDVKPANVLLEAGHAVLADFGLAKALSAAGDLRLTRAGFAVGTPAYVSPEQAGGNARIDGRSDLYSLGCVLYEMLAGQPPFVGPSADSVVRQHLTQDPVAISVIRPAVSTPAEEILRRLLAKSPADRFDSADELMRALDAALSGEWKQSAMLPALRHRRLRRAVLLGAGALVLAGAAVVWMTRRGQSSGGARAGLLDPRTVAVLYFEDLSPGGELRYVADGLTEGLIRELSRVDGLDVVSGNGVAPFRTFSQSPSEIAGILEAGTLIRGRVEPAQGQLRVSVRLVEGTSGADFERAQFEVASGEFLAAQDSLVDEVARLLRRRLGEEVRLRRRLAETSSVEAWALVQRGEQERRAAEERVKVGDAEGALSAFDGADSLLALAASVDPDWPEPPTLRGWVAYRESRIASNLEDALAAIERGTDRAEEALSLDPNAPRALELRGTLRYWHFLLGVTPDPADAEALLRSARTDLEAAVDRDPSLASAQSTLSHLYYSTGELTRASIAAQLAYEADAYLDVANEVLWRLFLSTFDTGRLTQARGWCQEGHRRFPDDYRFSECRLWELTMPTVTPDVDDAWELWQRTVELTPDHLKAYEEHRALMGVACVIARADLPDSARAVLSSARAGPDVDLGGDLPFLEARVQTVLGDYDRAIDLLRSFLTGYAFENQEQAEEWANHWFWRDLRGNSDFEQLIRVSG